MELKRKTIAQLKTWQQSPQRKPLVLYGARQVGKTHAIKRFAAEEFDSLAMIDFSRDSNAHALFQGSLSPENLIANLELYLHMTIHPDRTLVVFDEVQLCERALTSLKYFCEDAPQYHVIAAGSLLGVRINRDRDSFPVGKVDMMRMYPLDFEEFLWACDESALSDAIRSAYSHPSEAFPLHDMALELARNYEITGGMPEVLTSFIAHGAEGISAFEQAKQKQQELNVAYASDIVKYASTAEAPRILAAWSSIPRQLAKENHKFQYKIIKSGARASQYEAAIDWLLAAGVALRCTRVEEGAAPLKAFEDPQSFKLYMSDVGLLSQVYDALPSDVEPSADKAAQFRGALAENFVFQQFIAQGATAHYWGTASKAEVEFIARTDAGDVIPIEVKSGKNVTSKSLNVYRREYEPPYAVRISTKNFGMEGGILSIPLYAAWLLGEELR